MPKYKDAGIAPGSHVHRGTLDLKCNEKDRTWCSAMQAVIKPDPFAQGFSVAYILNTAKRVGDPTALTARVCYRKGRGRKAPFLYLNACPWCFARFNEDLQEERETKNV